MNFLLDINDKYCNMPLVRLEKFRQRISAGLWIIIYKGHKYLKMTDETLQICCLCGEKAVSKHLCKNCAKRYTEARSIISRVTTANMGHNKLSQMGKIGSRNRAKNLTPEQRQAIARMGGIQKGINHKEKLKKLNQLPEDV